LQRHRRRGDGQDHPRPQTAPPGSLLRIVRRLRPSASPRSFALGQPRSSPASEAGGLAAARSTSGERKLIVTRRRLLTRQEFGRLAICPTAKCKA
jgi:hypothetical protein